MIERLKNENPVYQRVPVPDGESKQKDLLRALMNVRDAKPIG